MAEVHKTCKRTLRSRKSTMASFAVDVSSLLLFAPRSVAPLLHATRTRIHPATFARQIGQLFSWAEHVPHTLWWPHGFARCDFGSAKHTMHVVSPPSVDSGTSARRPVMSPTSASVSGAGACGGGGGGSEAMAVA